MIPITVENLVKKFGKTAALNGLGFRVEPGELFFLLGPSGCGKTTLLRSVAGFCIPDSGRILFGEEDVTRLPPHKRHTGMMFQSYALWPHMSVEKNVAFGLEEKRVPRPEVKARVRAVLDSVRMADLAGRRIAELSGGQQQRVALARALVVRPRCLLLDEPLSNLDAKLRLEMRSEIRRVCKEFGLTAIYVTHDQKEALSISDRMAVLESGRVAQIGTPEEIFRRPRSKFVAGFIGETNFLPGRIQRASGGGQAVVETPVGTFEGFVGDPNWVPRPGEEAILSIRPECWVLHKDRAAGNCANGRIGEAVYLGEVAQYRFAAGAHSLKILELNPHPSARPPGSEFFASVRSGDVAVLRR